MRFFSDLNVLPPDVLGKSPRIVLSGRQEVLVEQHRGLYSYDVSRIRIRTADGILCVSGQNLTIAYFGPEDLLIRGVICDISLKGEDA